MLAKHFKADSHAVPRLHWQLWAVVLVLLIACPSVDKWQRHRESRQEAEYTQLAAASARRMREHLPLVFARNDNHTRRVNWLYSWGYKTNSDLVRLLVNKAVSVLPPPARLTRRELENEVNGGAAFETQRVFRWDFTCACHNSDPLPCEMAAYTPPDGGSPFHLIFKDDVLVHVEDSGLPERRRQWGTHACQYIHQQWQTWGPRLWLGVLGLPFILRRHRVVLAELLTAVALLMVVSSGPDLAGLFQRGGWQSISRDVGLAWAMFMVSTSAAVLTWALLRQANVSRILCSLCGYNLRGNTTGLCPECGTKLPPGLHEQLVTCSSA